MKKRVWSLLLAVCLCLSLLPASVMAADPIRITEIEVNLTLPKNGENKNDQTFLFSVDESAPYYLDRAHHYGWSGTFAEDNCFHENQMYMLIESLLPKPGYRIPHAGMSFTVHTDEGTYHFTEQDLDKSWPTEDHDVGAGYFKNPGDIEGIEIRFSCKTEQIYHDHQWSEEWSYDETHHWHACVLPGCEETNPIFMDGYGKHEYDNAADETCNVCGYVRELDKTTFLLNSYGDMYATQYCLAQDHVTIPAALGDKSFANGGIAGIVPRALQYGDMKTVSIEEGVPVLGQYMFQFCSNLKEVIVPASVKLVDYCCFSDSGIEEIVFLGDSAIVGNAFDQMSDLKTVYFSDQITFDWNLTPFSDCPSLTTINYEGTEEQWNALIADKDYYLNSYNVTVNFGVDPSERLNIHAANMTLGNDLSMNFFIKADDVPADDEAYKVRITKHYADNRDDVVVEVPRSEWKPYQNNTLWKVTFKGVAAKEMSDPIEVQVLHADGTPAGSVHHDSVRDYVRRMLDNPSTVPAVKTMLVDMLNYGAAAQQLFSYNENDLANKFLTSEELDFASTPLAIESHRESGRKFVGTKLNLGNTVALKFVFDDLDPETMYAEVTYTDYRNREKSMTLPIIAVRDKSGEVHYEVMVSSLVLSDARQMVRCDIRKSPNSSVTYATDSVEGYVTRKNDDFGFKLMQFADSAKAYLLSK